jgi:hypothetical protein
MKTILTAAAIGALTIAAAGPALALDQNGQTATQPTQRIIDQPSDATQKVPDTSPEETGAIDHTVLQPGKNSFTEGQAKSRIQAAGFTNVGTLIMDEQGIWRASANKGAMKVTVGLDYQGTVAVDSKSTE